MSFSFSDQFFLVKTKDFKVPIYNESIALSERYPKYGGVTFEKRFDSWMKNHNYQRVTFKNGYYLHEDVPTNKYRRKIEVLMGKYDKCRIICRKVAPN